MQGSDQVDVTECNNKVEGLQREVRVECWKLILNVTHYVFQMYIYETVTNRWCVIV
jgi:hypothetical protein